jgi:hypothetical protein
MILAQNVVEARIYVRPTLDAILVNVCTAATLCRRELGGATYAYYPALKRLIAVAAEGLGGQRAEHIERTLARVGFVHGVRHACRDGSASGWFWQIDDAAPFGDQLELVA